MCAQALAIGQSDYHRSNNLKPLGRDLLRGDVLLEGLCTDTTELAREAVRREGVVRPRRVVATTVD
jgi:hypothetical protein